MISSITDISDTWLKAFLGHRDPAQTEREAGFVAAIVPGGSRVLDLACGYGRHAALLGTLGYDVVGLDRDARVLPNARRHCPVVQADMRRIPFASQSFDAVMSLWQSFGYFPDEENLTLLSDLLDIVRPGGLLVLDLYNREFFENTSSSRQFARGGAHVTETTSLTGDRLRVHLLYDEGREFDEFEWQVFSPETLKDAATAAGWIVAGQFSDFDRSRAPVYGAPRIQHVLSRPSAG